MSVVPANLRDYSYVNALVRAETESVFSKMLGMEFEAVVIGEAISDNFEYGILSVIGMAGAVNGSGSISLQEPLACLIASRLLLNDYHNVSDDVLNAVSEVCNMIIGNVKTCLEQKCGPMELSTPTSIYRRKYRIQRSAGETIMVSFRYCKDDIDEMLNVRVCLVSENAGQSDFKVLASLHSHLGYTLEDL